MVIIRVILTASIRSVISFCVIFFNTLLKLLISDKEKRVSSNELLFLDLKLKPLKYYRMLFNINLTSKLY